MTIALVLFALAAVGGLVLALQRLSGNPLPSLPLALHAGAALSALSVFAIGLALRSSDHGAPRGIILLEIGGALCLAVTGWCGGHLVFHHDGVSVRESPSGASHETRVHERPIEQTHARRHARP